MDTNTFFFLMFALTAVDAWTTYRAIKSGRASEANPLMRGVFKAAGLKGGLTLAKAGGLALLWFTQPHSDVNQWLLVGIYAAVAINNLYVMRKAGLL